MSSSNPELVIQITEGSSITQLISVLRCSFQKKEYDEVESLLIHREEKLQMELNNLRRDFDLMKQQRDSLEKSHSISELDRLMMEQELKRLRSDYKVSIDKVSSVEYRYKIVAEELKKVEIENRTERNKMIEELAQKSEELDGLRTERNEMIEKLTSEKHDVEKTVSLLHRHLQDLEGRVSIIEERVAKVLDKDVLHAMRNSYFQDMDVETDGSFPLSSAAMESSVNGGLSGGSSFEGESGDLDVKNTLSGANAQDEVHVLLRSHLLHNATGIENPDFPDFGTTAENEHDNAKTLGVAQSTFDRPPVETNGFRQSEVSPAAALMSTNVSGHNEMCNHERRLEIESSSEKAASFIQVSKKPIIVVISDSEDESVESGSSDASVLHVTEINLTGKKVPLKEENGSECLKDSHINLMLNRKRSKTDLDGTDNFKVARRKRKDGALYDSSGSEDDNICFLSYMENKLTKFIRHNKNTWKFAGDLLSALAKDYELCMNAVCALYRRKISAKKSNSSSSIPGDLAFFHFDAMSGNALAEYLIDGHSQNKLKKTVLQVQQEDPQVLAQCKNLAIHYSEMLFDIYTDGRDRFFRPDL